MAYSYESGGNKGKKYFKDAGSWKLLSMWGTADNVELDGAAIQSNLPAAFNTTTVHGFLQQVDTYFGQSNGFASLGADGKLTAGQVPSGLAGGMSFVGGVSASQDIESLMNAQIGATPAESDAGKYFIVTTAGQLTNGSGDTLHHEIQAGAGDGAQTDFPMDLEVGDWLVLLNVDTGTPLYTWGIIDNDYATASTSGEGVVQLSDASAVTGLVGNHVVTEGVLAALIGASDGFLMKTTAGWDGTGGFMKADGDGTFSVDTNTYLTNYVAKSETLTGYSEAVAFAEVTSSDTILSAIEQLAYTAKTAYNWGDHTSGGYQSAGAAVGINESGAGSNADSLLLTLNYRNSGALAQNINVWADGATEKIWFGGSALNDMPIVGVQVNATTPTTEGNNGDLWIVTS